MSKLYIAFHANGVVRDIAAEPLEGYLPAPAKAASTLALRHCLQDGKVVDRFPDKSDDEALALLAAEQAARTPELPAPRKIVTKLAFMNRFTMEELSAIYKATGQYQGVHAFLAAQPAVKVTPRILTAPGFTHRRPLDPGDKPPSPDLKSAPATPRAAIVADGPNTTDTAAIDYRKDWGSPRIYVVDPHVKVMKGGAVVTEPASARIAFRSRLVNDYLEELFV